MTTPAPDRPEPARITVRGATFLGIGSMIGAGIFALLGEAGAVAGAAVWISFLIGGAVSLSLGYVCVKLGVRFPSSGGLSPTSSRASGAAASSGRRRGSATSPPS